LSIHELASIVLAKEPTVTKLVGASPDGQKLASWVGMCPGNNESAGKRKSGRIRKGNAWVRRLLCEFAQAAGNKSLCTQRQVPSAQRTQRAQAIHRGAGAQDAAHDLRDAEQEHPLRGQNRGLRGADGGASCAAVAADAGQARVRSSTGLI